MLCIPRFLVEYLSNIHTLFFRENEVQKLKCCQICEESTSHVHMPLTKSTKNVSNVHKVIIIEPNFYLCHIVMYSIDIHFVSPHTLSLLPIL